MKHLGVVIVLGGLLCVAALTLSRVCEPQELAVYDWLMRTRPSSPTHPDIVIIEISDDTLKSLGRWPLPRQFHITLIKALTESGARMIVFDALFSEPQGIDAEFASAIKESGRVYLASAFRIKPGGLNSDRTHEADEILGAVSEPLKSAAAGIGQVNIFVDGDGKPRRVPLWVRHGNRLWPSLGFLAAVECLGYSQEKIIWRSDKVIFNDNKSIPIEPKGVLWVNYPGQWVNTFRHFSYVDVLKAYVAGKSGAQPWLDMSVFKDKICFVGLTAAGTSDLRATPLDTIYPMVGAQASICDSILREAFIKRISPWAKVLLHSAILLFALMICLKCAPLAALIGCGALALGYSAAGWLIFSYRGILPDMFLPLIVVGIVYVVILFRNFFNEARKRQLLEKELEIASAIQRSFLPPDASYAYGVEIRAMLEPAKFVAGDFYDIIALEGSRLGVFIGDVCGKGVSAALIMAQAISFLRVVSQQSLCPAEVLKLLNTRLEGILNGRFVTGQYIVIDAKEGIWEGACAGHPPLILLDSAKDLPEEFLPASGPPLGITGTASYAAVKRRLKAGDKIFMYTDGWTEGRNRKGEEFGVRRLKEALFSLRNESVPVIMSSIAARRSAFEGNAPQHDDLTAILVEFKGTQDK